MRLGQPQADHGAAAILREVAAPGARLRSLRQPGEGKAPRLAALGRCLPRTTLCRGPAHAALMSLSCNNRSAHVIAANFNARNLMHARIDEAHSQ